MNNTDLPPLPAVGEHGPEVCTTIRLYLAVLPDVSTEQARVLFEHVRTCSDCAAELRLMTLATYLASPADMTPPPQVDQAIRAAIAERSSIHFPEYLQALRSLQSHHTLRNHRFLWLIGQVAAVVVLLTTLTVVYFLNDSLATLRAFALPASLSWSGYVLYYHETKMGANGMQYNVNCYHDLGTGHMHVETMARNDLDIVTVGDDQALLGEDLIHHIAQWNAYAWSVDDSMFNLAQLRSDLQAHRALYERTDVFHGQEVYRVRWKDGLVLLLNKHYWPVNVLRNAHGPGTGEPIYETLTWLKVSQVPSTLWDIRVPAGFRIGDLPEGP
jgi:hypothetical protein